MSKEKLLKELAKQDEYYRNELQIAKDNVSKLIEITKKRLFLYTKYTNLVDDINITLIDSMKSDIYTQLLLYEIKREFEEKINGIMIRLDEIEEHIQKP